MKKINKRTERHKFLFQHISKTLPLTILEIGAFNYPTFSEDSIHDIKNLDWFSKEELQVMYPHRKDNIVNIDYICKSINFNESVDQTFDMIIANHVIEHIPNMILWLQNIEKVLVKGGVLFLTIPNKENTFDYLRQNTKVSDLLDRFYRNVNQPEIKDVFDQKYNYRPLKTEDFFNVQLVEEKLKFRRYKNAKGAWGKCKAMVENKGYIDVHCNVFTYEAFGKTIHELQSSGFSNLEIIGQQKNKINSNEFYYLLKK